MHRKAIDAKTRRNWNEDGIPRVPGVTTTDMVAVATATVAVAAATTTAAGKGRIARRGRRHPAPHPPTASGADPSSHPAPVLLPATAAVDDFIVVFFVVVVVVVVIVVVVVVVGENEERMRRGGQFGS